eukprot:CAMPEP_0116090872 /NCGR_PEP_ID=MMETSP0327-20121206/7201_1 /TAXON_ID=44447 /ORGANISM="Pseudo-nitzschia delicatissima, Strain B596" /LENGTH=354 /DNA_ID=CAMNT_0003582181 /DNA_START=488 /DNA_END=1552 /DNA_ORIENTATION=+
MGRRKLLPNINNLLLQLHLPHRSNGGEANESKEVPDDSSPKEEAHFHHNNTTTHHHQHHNHHIFTWPSLKRRPSSSSLASNSSEDDHDHDHEHDNEICHDTETEPATCCGNRRQITSNDVIHHGIHDVIHDVIHDGIHSDSHKSVVSFGNCEVRTYTQVLGDHPCCSEGCPIQLGWSYTREESIKVDDYERVYHTVNSQEEGGDKEDSAAMQKYTVLHELRLTPEERRSILILSKQQEYVNAASSIGSDSQDSNSADCPENDENNGDSNTNCCESLTACNKDQAAATPTTFQNHERELIRECRRLNRCGGWNVNVKASRKRNKRTQEAFFGCPVTTISRIPPEDATASTPANKP